MTIVNFTRVTIVTFTRVTKVTFTRVKIVTFTRVTIVITYLIVTKCFLQGPGHVCGGRGDHYGTCGEGLSCSDCNR